jgi:ATP-binding cassette subfamily B protein RaxB
MADELNFARRRRLPLILGAEAAECGLACLAMVAVWHGHDVDLNGLRQRYSLSTRGVTLRTLMELGDELGLSTRPLRVELEGLGEVQTPAVLHWNLNHFVVLKRCHRDGVTIHDPASGAHRMTWARASAFHGHSSGVYART